MGNMGAMGGMPDPMMGGGEDPMMGDEDQGLDPNMDDDMGNEPMGSDDNEAQRLAGKLVDASKNCDEDDIIQAVNQVIAGVKDSISPKGIEKIEKKLSSSPNKGNDNSDEGGDNFEEENMPVESVVFTKKIIREMFNDMMNDEMSNNDATKLPRKYRTKNNNPFIIQR